MKILCLFGKHQYGDSLRGESTEFFSFIPALKALGHEVTLFDSWDKSLYKDYASLNKNLVERCEQLKPDIIFWVALTVEIWIDTLNYIRSYQRVRILHWAPDDSWKYFQQSRFIAPYVELCVTTYPMLLNEYKKLGVKAVLSGWGVPASWASSVIPFAECKYDVSFVGAAQPKRKKFIGELQRRGVNVLCFGHGWPAGSVEAEKIPKIFRDSRISLNFANSTGTNQVKARMFEVTGAGGFLLTQNAPGISEIFGLNSEIGVFNDADECVKRIRHYLDNPDERDKLAKAGNLRTLMNYTYTERLQKVLVSIPIPSIDSKLVTCNEAEFTNALLRHRKTFLCEFTASLLTVLGSILFGVKRGRRFARRISFEIGWRLSGEKIYRAEGIVGRMFYE